VHGTIFECLLVAHLQLHKRGLLTEERHRNDVSDGYSWWCAMYIGCRESSFLTLLGPDTPVADAIDDAEIF